MTGVRSLLIAFVLLAAGCGTAEPPWLPWLVDLDDHPDPLTDSAGDALFVIDVLEADQRYPLEQLIVEINPYGGEMRLLDSWQLSEDANGDGLLGAGDQLIVDEGATSIYDQSHSGVLFEVRLRVLEPGSEAPRTLAERQWVGDGGLG